MKNIFRAILIGFSLLTACSRPQSHDPLMVMTVNIRYNNPDDGINAWPHRENILANTILKYSPAIIGMQEVLFGQLENLDSLLAIYDHVGVGREDGKEKGEFAPIFFRSDILKELRKGTFWLSPTPSDTGSVGWDAALTRIVTWVKFRNNQDNTEFYFINTHFDHMGKEARLESAKLIRKFIAESTESLPVILSGDFNCSPEDAPYQYLTEKIFDYSTLNDALVASPEKDIPHQGTFNGFGTEKDKKRIDFIFADDHWDVLDYKILDVKEGDVYISDHWPVLATLKLKN